MDGVVRADSGEMADEPGDEVGLPGHPWRGRRAPRRDHRQPDAEEGCRRS